MKQTKMIGKRTRLALAFTGVILGGILIGILLNAPAAAQAQQSQLTPDEARQAAEAVSPGATATDVSMEREGGLDVYEVQLDNGMEVEIDAATGEILETELEDDGDDANDGPDEPEADNDD